MRGIYECMTLIITEGLLHALQFPMNNYFKIATICWAPINIAAVKSLQSCPTLCDPIDGSPPGSTWWSWDSPGKNTGVGCHFLLQCMKGKSESEVAQLCLTLRDPMVCSLPGSSVHEIFQARVLEWGAIAFSESKANHSLFLRQDLPKCSTQCT